LRLAQLFETEFGRSQLIARVAYHVPASDFMPGDAHRRLPTIPWAAVVTTNYDDLLERAFDRTRPMRRVVVDEDLTTRRPPNECILIKLHGDLTQPSTIVLTEDDFLSFESKRPGLSVKVRQLLSEHPLMFLGFSLTDPNYLRIDRWIRDTVREVRLPAISVVHSEPGPGELKLWKARGIDLIQLRNGESLSQLIDALVSARPNRKIDMAAAYNSRVNRLEAEAIQIAKDADSNRVARVAKLVIEILSGIATDTDGGAEVRRFAMHFASGWHMLSHGVRRLGVGQQSISPIAIKEIYENLPSSQQKMLLMLALEEGVENLRLDDTAVSIAHRLLDLSLSVEERATVHLYHARILRSVDRVEDAEREIDAARRCEPSKELKVRITLEYRELVFQEGDRKRLEAELHTPLDDNADILAMCRRGSDYLLLDMRSEADRWYKDALVRASSGDERVAALLGRLIARHKAFSTDAPETAELDELRRDLHSIPEIEQPESTKVRALIDQAGGALLNGNSHESAVNRIESYLEEVRRLGWPHSPSHDLSTPIEIAVRQCARLLLERDDDDELDVSLRVRKALVLLNRYGLAQDIRKLFTHQHRETISRSQDCIDWFRQFCAAQPTLPRCADARLTTAVVGLSLLEDGAIVSTVAAVVERIERWRADGSRVRVGSLVGGWWEDVISACEHLPLKAAMHVLNAYCSFLCEPLATVRLGSPLSISLWLQQGFIAPGGVESRSLVDAGISALRLAFNSSRDTFWVRQISHCLGQAAEDGLFDEVGRCCE
jgi:SIR2-like domain